MQEAFSELIAAVERLVGAPVESVTMCCSEDTAEFKITVGSGRVRQRSSRGLKVQAQRKALGLAIDGRLPRSEPTRRFHSRKVCLAAAQRRRRASRAYPVSGSLPSFCGGYHIPKFYRTRFTRQWKEEGRSN